MPRIDSSLWIKICGLTQPDQAVAIAQLGVSAIGLICVPASPRYVTDPQIRTISQALLDAELAQTERVGVFANATLSAIQTTVTMGLLTTLQLHGDESPAICRTLRQNHPSLKLIKALRIRSTSDLAAIAAYESCVDAFLLDAYHPHLLGGTGKTLDWGTLQSFRPAKPWILAGGLTPDNVQTALDQLSPQGIDVSSGVELTPGHKSLPLVQNLLNALPKSAVGRL